MTATPWIITGILAYVLCGLAVAVAFAAAGAARVDGGARDAGWRFKALIIPASAALWPLVLSRWVRAARPRP